MILECSQGCDGRIGKTDFAAVAMKIKKGGFKFFFDFFHQTS
jgi:hypothetical protein